MQTEANAPKQGFSIAIDGPVAAGKGTISVLLSKRLNGFYLYTGGMYRALAFYCSEKNINVNSEASVVKILPEVFLDVQLGRILLNNHDVTKEINNEKTAKDGSKVATYSQVRTVLAEKQQEIVKREINGGKIVVGEGRDTATIVMPDAKLKIFMTARPEVRANRRLQQIIQRGERKASVQNVLSNLQNRDKQDIEREVNPLVSNPERHGYFVLDNSDISENETIDIVINELKNRKLIS